jgi:tight adherence protein B
MDPQILAFAAFIGVAGGMTAVFFLIKDLGGNQLEGRLDILAGKKKPDAESFELTKESLFADSKTGLARLFDGILERFGNLKLLFVQADTKLKPDMFFVITIGCVAVGVAIAYFTRAPLPLFPVFGLALGVLPLGWLLWKRNKRFARFSKQLPDALELVARALRSGHSLASGINVVVEEMSDPVSKEFRMAYEEQNLGVPLELALKNVQKRMPNMDFGFFATAVAIQRQAGGDLAEILDKIGHIVRERFRILGQVQALTGEGRISGIVLMALPIALFFAVWHMNPDYVMQLFTDELGRKMVAVAAVLQVLGAICIKKIIDIKV